MIQTSFLFFSCEINGKEKWIYGEYWTIYIWLIYGMSLSYTQPSVPLWVNSGSMTSPSCGLRKTIRSCRRLVCPCQNSNLDGTTRNPPLKDNSFSNVKFVNISFKKNSSTQNNSSKQNYTKTAQKMNDIDHYFFFNILRPFHLLWCSLLLLSLHRQLTQFKCYIISNPQSALVLFTCSSRSCNACRHTYKLCSHRQW